jgi:O-antigen/teichoic acid export membrane protein
MRMNDHHLAKGSIYLITSYVLFYLSGYLIHFVLARNVSPSTYGAIGVILSILTLLQILLMQGIPTAAAKYLSEGADGKEIRNKSLILQFVYALLICLLVYLLSTMIADVFRDKTFIPYLKFLPIVIFIRSINQLFNNFFGGYREFKRQAIHMAIDSFPRALFVFLFIYLGYGIYGVLGGYAAASLTGLIYAVILFKPKVGQTSVGYAQIINFSFPVILYAIFFQLLTSLDLFFIKTLSGSGEYVGFYTSARVLCTTLTIVSAALSLTLLPSISHSVSTKDVERTNAYIQTSMRYLLMFFVPIAVIISVQAKGLLSLFFTPEYAKAGNALSLLVWAWFFLQTFFVISAMINASGRSKIPAGIAAISILISAVSNTYLVDLYGIEGGALATLITGIVSLGAGLYYVYRIYQISVHMSSTLRICVASGLVLGISVLAEPGGILLIGWILLLFTLYVAFLFLVKVINHEDILLMKALIRSFVPGSLRAEL